MLQAKNIGKKYAKHWIFRNINHQFNVGSSAITGRNGSGKSTLLKIISGYLTPSEGELLINNKKPDIDDFYQIGFSAPYIELPEEFLLNEFLDFHGSFKKKIASNEEMAEKSSLPLTKRISEFSTGMKQRVQLLTLFYYQNDFIFMDEPTSNLDEQGFNWWKSEFEKLKGKTIVLASNEKAEISCCEHVLNLN